MVAQRNELIDTMKQQQTLLINKIGIIKFNIIIIDILLIIRTTRYKRDY